MCECLVWVGWITDNNKTTNTFALCSCSYKTQIHKSLNVALFLLPSLTMCGVLLNQSNQKHPVSGGQGWGAECQSLTSSCPNRSSLWLDLRVLVCLAFPACWGTNPPRPTRQCRWKRQSTLSKRCRVTNYISVQRLDAYRLLWKYLMTRHFSWQVML